MNKLLDRYLAAIRRELPQRHADEIVDELRDALLSKIEDREADLGRPMSNLEIEQLLIDFGHPLVVAGRYRKTQYLIGPETFPMWFATLRFVLLFGGAVMLIGLAAAAASTNANPAWVLQRLGETFWPAFLWVFAVVTLVFAVSERMGKYRIRLIFNPRQLPPVRSKRRRAPQIASEMVMGAVALLWWLGLIKFRSIMPIPPFLGVQLASAWDPFRAPIAAYLVVEIIINGLALMRPNWVRLVSSLSFAKDIAACVIMGLVLQTGHWVEIDAPTLAPSVQEMIQQGFDRGLRVGLGVTFLVFVFKALADAWRLWNSLGNDGGHAGNGASAATLVG